MFADKLSGKTRPSRLADACSTPEYWIRRGGHGQR
jgi:hypothetical protein